MTKNEPKKGKTHIVQKIDIYADVKTPFSAPSASIIEIDKMDYRIDKNGTVVHKTSFNYEPILCRFGRFGTTEAIYVDSTHISCVTPSIKDDSDIGYEEVYLEVALNGQDFVQKEEVTYTFEGPDAGSMIFVYLLIFLFLLVLLILLAGFISTYWDKVGGVIAGSRRSNYYGDEPHIENRMPRYVNPEFRDYGEQSESASENSRD